MSASLIIALVSIASMPAAYDMARDRCRSTEAWLRTAMIFGPLALLALLMLKKIPDAEKGWPAAQRVRWFRTFAMNVSQIYDGEAMDPVELKIEIDLENDPSLTAK
jgi:hypothetical protein